jgi:hypothetical protein
MHYILYHRRSRGTIRKGTRTSCSLHTHCRYTEKVLQAVRELAAPLEQMRGVTDLIETAKAVATVVSAKTRRELKEQYEHLSSHAMHVGGNTFKVTVLNMLAQAQSNCPHLVHTQVIEDFIWQRLYFARPREPEGALNEHAYTVEHLAEKILDLGNKNYFDVDGKNPWAYVKVLLVHTVHH